MQRTKQKRRSLRKFLVYTAGFIALWFGVHVSWLLVDGFTDELHRADLAVVFGNKVHPNGQPSKRLRMRLDRTLQLYKKGYFPTILVSGGKGVEGYDEAVIMKRYLVAQGIPSQAILVDSLGLTTRHTALHAAQLLRSRNWHSVLLISQYFHISRAKLAARRAGIPTAYSAHAIYHFEWREIYSTAREVLGFYAYLFVTFRTFRDINLQHTLDVSN
ncbi:MAG: YdcF family protein [Deltaproteobacteria bacterium]|nr:MAG: YdcF family protein [Deltaproteobacteria bacterium]